MDNHGCKKNRAYPTVIGLLFSGDMQYFEK
jgi:hypothetical protein